MYADYENHNLFLAEIPKNYDAAMIYKEKNFEIKYILRTADKHISIQTSRNYRTSKESDTISFTEGDNIIKDIIDEQRFLFIIACLMNGLSELIIYYYNNKKL